MTDAVGLVRFSPDNIAAQWWLAGCAVIPIRTDGTKAPVFKWKVYQTTGPDASQVQNWFENQYSRAGVAVICGQVSGNLEMLELEGRSNGADTIAHILSDLRDAGEPDLWDYLTAGYSEISPSGGLHVMYRISDMDVPSNEKIATRPAYEDEITDDERETMARNPGTIPLRVLAETRGEGGYVVVAPTGGHCHPTGRPWRALTGSPEGIRGITWAQRNILVQVIRKILHIPAKNEVQREPGQELAIPRQRVPGDILRPGDDFNIRASWEEPWFTEQGWIIHHREPSGELFWTRPGKPWADGHSASTSYSPDGDRLYVWSTSTSLPTEQPLSKFFVYAHYHHGGDMGAATRALRYRGYGDTNLIARAAPLQELDVPFGDDGQGAVQQVADPNANINAASHSLNSVLQMQAPKGGLLFTDVGYARRIMDACRQRFRYNGVEKCWYVWDQGAGIWGPDRFGEMERTAEHEADETLRAMHESVLRAEGGAEAKQAESVFKEAREALSSRRLSAIITRFRSQPGIMVDAEDFDGNTDLLNLQNCTLNLVTRQPLNYNPDNMLTGMFNANYDPDAKCVRWTQFLEEVFPEAGIRLYVQRAMGYSLLGRPVERVMFLLHGPSGTGKSVFTSVMTRLFGTYGATAPATTFRLKKNETTVDLHQLRGSRFVATSEMPEGAQLDEELVKRLTGGDIIRSRALYESYHSWRAQCVIWIATNFLPRLSSDDNAIWRRARTIPMRTEFGPHAAKTEVKGLADQLFQERDGILNWLLDGLEGYRRRGLDEPSPILDDIATYRREVDSVASWFESSIRDGSWLLEKASTSPSALVYQSYTQYCQEVGFSALGRVRFNKRVTSIDSSLESKKVGGQMMWFGLKKGLSD